MARTEKGRIMTEGKSKPKTKSEPRTSEVPRPAAKTKRSAKTSAKKADGATPVLAAKKSHEQATGKTASLLIDQRIRDLGDWRGDVLARMRALILEADPEMTEEWKWMGTPVWAHQGIVCTGESYKKVVKLTFAQGAKVADPSRLFNSSLDGNTRRAIDIHEGEMVDAVAFKSLIKAAVAQNGSTTSKAKGARPAASDAKPVKLLSGGNPQIAKADGDAPVQQYIAAMPGWKSDVGRWLDALIVQCVPNVQKAVKWNSPLYGVEGQGWFLGVHTFARYVKIAFFNGTSLQPMPPQSSKDKNTRYFHIHEDDQLDEAQVASWVKQAAALPGWIS
ncbi:DUF1801 domain-containing protein [Schlesneria paludicola]|uniref:DUF1801 domain-containing protein n=1 Tax=Schlesneria paludicola TaxID=360056 RepID=UPI00192ACF0B|nr:DUF1801 domain-containing protein [Schlesneria paludicola]